MSDIRQQFLITQSTAASREKVAAQTGVGVNSLKKKPQGPKAILWQALNPPLRFEAPGQPHEAPGRSYTPTPWLGWHGLEAESERPSSI